MHKDPRSSPTTHIIKLLGMLACACNPRAVEAEAGRSLKLASQPAAYLMIPRLSRDPVSKKHMDDG